MKTANPLQIIAYSGRGKSREPTGSSNSPEANVFNSRHSTPILLKHPSTQTTGITFANESVCSTRILYDIAILNSIRTTDSQIPHNSIIT
jgi:hypothetical protein